MESRETRRASLDLQVEHEVCTSFNCKTLKECNCLSFGFTLAIAPFKRIISSENPKGVSYSLLSKGDQLQVLNRALKLFEVNHYKICTVEEETQAGNMHIHGYVYCPEFFMQYVQDGIHHAYGMGKVKTRCFNYSASTLSPSFWQKYMQKELDYIPDVPLFKFN
jgi:hypothetical protein